MISRSPINANQKIAMDYRRGTIQVLEKTYGNIAASIQEALMPSPLNPLSHASNHFTVMSIEGAWAWCHAHFPTIHDAAMVIISEDQEEPLPLDWAVLLEDWNHTLWIFWIMIMWLVRASESESLTPSSEVLAGWMDFMDQ